MGAVKEIYDLKRKIKLGTFNSDIEQFNKDYGADYLSSWHTADEINTYYDRLADLNERTKAYQTYINTYGTDEQKSSLENIGKQVNAYDEIIGARQDVLDYYGGFSSADEFKTAFEQYAEQQAADEEFFNTYDIEGAKVKLDKLEKQHKSPIQDPFGYIGDLGAYYGELDAEIRQLEDDISRWENIYNTKKYSQYTGTAEYNPAYSKYGNLYESVYSGHEIGPLNTYGDVFAEGKDKSKYQYLTEAEKKKFYSLWEQRGEKAASEYIDYLTPYLYSRSQEKRKASAKDQPFWHSVGAALEDIAIVPIEQLNRYVEYGLTGKTNYNLTAQEVELTQNAVTEDMGKLGSFLYGTASSGATSLAAGALSSAVGGPVGEVLLGLSAAAHTQNDVLARGGNSTQAAIGGIAAGAFEALFEHMSISRLKMFQPDDWVPNLKVVLKELAKSMGVNASEEMLTEVANIAFDIVNTRELSNAVMQYEELIKNGVPKGEAFWQTVGSNVAQVLEAGASGALMGAGFSAIGGSVGLAKTDSARRQLGKEQIKEGNVESLLTDAKELFKDAKYKDEQALIKKVEEGLGKKGPSQQRNVGKLTGRVISTKFRELNKQVAEQSLENVAETRKNVESETKKFKVNSSSAEINYDNMPQILGFEGANLDKTMVETEQGAVKLTDMEISNAEIGDLYAYAVRLGSTESANAFIQNWDQTTDPLYYWLDWTKLQTRGLYAPEKMEKAMSDYADVKLSPAAKLAAFKSGMSLRTSAREKMEADSAKLKETYKELGGKAKKGKFDDSKLNYSALTKEQKDVVNFTKILSDYLGVNITYFKSEKGKRGANGYYRAKNNTIYLDIYAGIGNKESYSAIKDCLVNTVSHEIVHNMAVNAPAEYGALRDFVIERLSEEEGFDLDSRVEQIMLENSDQGFTAEDAIEEIVAMSCEDLLGSSERLQEAMTQFYAKNEKAANSFTKYVREVLNRLKQFFEKIIGKKSIAEESQLMAKQSADFISELQKRYDAALLAVKEGNAARGAQKAEEKVKEQKRTKNIFGYEINKDVSVNEDLLEELRIYDPTAEVNENGEITVYHRTSKDNAAAIRRTGIMKAKEDALFFSSKSEGYASDYGDTVITLKIPSTKLRINDIFDGEVHFDMPLKRIAGEWSANVSEWLVDESIEKVEKVKEQKRANTSNYLEYDKPITLKDIEVLRSIGRKSINDFTSEDIEKAQKWAYKFYKELGVKSPFFRAWFGDWREFDDVSFAKVVDTESDNRQPVKNADTGWLIQASRQVHKETSHHSGKVQATAVKYLPYIDDITQNAVLFNSEISNDDNPNSLMYHTMYAYTEAMGYPALLKLQVEELFYYNREKSGELMRDYILQNVEEESISKRNRLSRPNHLGTNSSVIRIADLFALVKQYDKNFSPAPEISPEAAKYLLNDDGTPKVFYHGSPNDFTVFERTKVGSSNDPGAYGRGFYFTPQKDKADGYAGNGRESHSYFLRMKNPLIINSAEKFKKFNEFYFEGWAESGFDDEILEEKTNELIKQRYDGIIVAERTKKSPSGNITTYNPNEYIVFESTQIKFATDNIGTFDSSNPDIRYQKRIETPGASEVLSELFRDNPNLNGYADQRKELKSYQELLRSVRVNEQRIAETDAEIKSLKSQKAQGGKGTRMAQLYEMRKTAEDRVTEKKNRMFKMEATSLKEVVTRETARLLQERTKEERSLSRQKQKDIRENYARREYIKKIEQRAKGLQEALTKNSKDKHIPEPFKKVVSDLITSIDFSSKRSLAGKGETKKDLRFAVAMKNMSDSLNLQGIEGSKGDIQKFITECDLGEEFIQKFSEEAKKINAIALKFGSQDEYVLNRMSAEDLKEVNSLLYRLSNAISKSNQLIGNSLTNNMNQLGQQFIKDAKEFDIAKKKGRVAQLLDLRNTLPYYAFKRMGKVGMSLFNEWADGFDKYSFLVDEIIEFTEKAYTAKEVKQWSNEVHRFTGADGTELYLTTADIMSLYLLNKRGQGLKHIQGGGIQAEEIKGKAEGDKIKKTYKNSANGVTTSEQMLVEVLSTLTDRQRDVADKLQQFLATTAAAWGNEISMKRFGTKQFTEEDYFPIETSSETLTKEGSKSNTNDIFALLNMSFTKALDENANNRIMIRNVFDVFAEHTTMMAKYNAFAVPLLDMRKFLNYKVKFTTDDDEKSGTSFHTDEVRAALVKHYGTEYEEYIDNFIKDIAGATRSEKRGAEVSQKFMSKYKIAAVAFNMRVVVLQGTSYLRASAVLEHKYLIKEIKDTPQLRRAIKTMEQYSGVAKWKSFGYHDVNVTKSVTEKIKHADTWMDKVTEASMKGAEIADKMTWGALWLACENEIKSKQKGFVIGSKEFYEATATRFREVIYATQVVDSPLTKSEFMRSKDGLAGVLGSFMSEPTVSYNLLLDAYHEIADTKRKGQKISWNNMRRVGRLAIAYAASAVAQTIVESLIDAMRDVADDEDEEYIDAYFKNALENIFKELSPFRKLPILKDFIDVVEKTFFGGYASNQRMDVAVVERLARAVREAYKLITGETSVSKTLKRSIEAISSGVGLPISNAYRELKTIWNNLMEWFNDGSGRIE